MNTHVKNVNSQFWRLQQCIRAEHAFRSFEVIGYYVLNCLRRDHVIFREFKVTSVLKLWLLQLGCRIVSLCQGYEKRFNKRLVYG